jgi:hypothetical protein
LSKKERAPLLGARAREAADDHEVARDIGTLEELFGDRADDGV